MEEYKMTAEDKERFSRRAGITIRCSAIQHQMLWEAKFLEKRPISAIARECLSEYFRLKHNWSFPMVLTDFSVDEDNCNNKNGFEEDGLPENITKGENHMLKKPENEKKKCCTCVRWTDDEMHLVVESAYAKRTSCSELIRSIVLEKLQTKDVSPELKLNT